MSAHEIPEQQCPAGGTHKSDHYICTKCGLKTFRVGSKKANEPSPEMQKLILDMDTAPELTTRQILSGERKPPPEFERLLAAVAKHAIEGEPCRG